MDTATKTNRVMERKPKCLKKILEQFYPPSEKYFFQTYYLTKKQ